MKKKTDECPKCQGRDIAMKLSIGDEGFARFFVCHDCGYKGEGESKELPKNGMWVRAVKRWNDVPRPILILEEV